MPLYEYQCDACGARFERIQKFSDPPIETCPACGGAVKKLVSSPAFQFKGSGWYVTDYARKGGEGKSKTDDATGDKATAGEGKAADPAEKTTEPAAKPVEKPSTSTGAKDA